jgi:hypothetical protein
VRKRGTGVAIAVSDSEESRPLGLRPLGGPEGIDEFLVTRYLTMPAAGGAR